MKLARRASKSVRISTVLILAMLAVAEAVIPGQAQITPTTVIALPGGTGQPVSPAGPVMAQGRNGDLYITNQDTSMLFSLTPAGVLTPGYSPGGLLFGVTLGRDGNFYGGNFNGGTNGFGTLYKTTPTGTGTVFYNFLFGSGPANPYAPPIEAANGTFYGTTIYNEERNGYFPDSVAYSVTSKGVFKILHTFTGTDGQNIYAGLVQGTDGNFYGCSSAGGTSSDGVIFKMTAAGKVTVLHNFDGTDGSNCSFSLVQASDGDFYGTANVGGSAGAGVVFKITSGGAYTVIHNFNGTTDGSYPNSSLIQATDGNLYGVTGSQGQVDNGSIYKVTTGGTLTTLYSFTGGTDGGIPQSALIQHTNGLLYGNTFTGGDLNCYTAIYYGGQEVIVAGCGVVFSVDIAAEPFVNLMTTSGKEASAVEILGQGFTKSSVVEFGGVAATKVALTGTTYMSATVPAGALTGTVTVTTGATKLTSPQTFKVLPTITSIPASGTVGTAVVITGTGLTQTTKVTFGGVAATGITVNSDTQVTATVPTGAKTGKIAVTTKGGSASSKTTFTVD
jgi:uncharacterized repeat protein (TIGR03803 family)